jgi:hypothetical protein
VDRDGCADDGREGARGFAARPFDGLNIGLRGQQGGEGHVLQLADVFACDAEFCEQLV